MGARRRSLLGGNKRSGLPGTGDDPSEAEPETGPLFPPEPASALEEPLTDPGEPSTPTWVPQRPPATEQDLLHAPPPPSFSEAAQRSPEPPRGRSEPQRAGLHADRVAFDAAPSRAPTPAPPAARALPEPSFVSFDQPPTLPEPTTPQAPAGGAWDSGWSPGSKGPTPLADAPVARELFGGGGFDELEDVPPPTEEKPSGVMEDVGQSYSTPYAVPEPPPIPGLVDRFTPPPLQRTELGDRKRKPEYLPDTPTGAANRGYEPTPAPVARRKAAPKASPDDAGGSGPPFLILAGIGAMALMGVGMAALAGAMYFRGGDGGGGGGEEQHGLSPGNPNTTVETRDDMRRKPVPLGEPPPAPSTAPEPTTAPAPTAPEAPEPGGAAVPGPGVPKPKPKPDPAAPVPKPPSEPAPKPPPVAVQGVLKIRSNRRAMVYVNNQVVGFTPLDHKIAPGTWSVAAVLPGQPTTRQERNVSATSAGGTTAVDFTF